MSARRTNKVSDQTHEGVLDLHSALVGLITVSGDVEVGHDGGKRCSQDDLSQILTTTHPSANTERDQVLRHPV